jgi:FecR protein
MSSARAFCYFSFFVFVVIASSATLPRASRAEAPIGQAVKAIDLVSASRNADKRQLVRDDPVFRNELVQTGDESYAGLAFNDGTTLSVGPNAEVLLDEFAYDDNNKSGQMVMTLSKGAVRFVTGSMTKSGYRIRTPTATLGIRGTIFIVLVLPDGQTWVFLQQGSATLSNLVGEAVQLNAAEPASSTAPAPSGSLQPPPTPPGAPPQVVVVQVPGLLNFQPAPGAQGSPREGAAATIVAVRGRVTAADIGPTLLRLAQRGGSRSTPDGTGATDLGAGLAVGLGAGIGAAVLFLVVTDKNGGSSTTTTTIKR